VLSKSKPLLYLRIFVTGTLIASFIFLSYLFIRQYSAFEKLNDQIALANNNSEDRSVALYNLFLEYSEADNLFRLFTTNFELDTYDLYNRKLEEIKQTVDSLSQLPEGYDKIIGNLQTLEEKRATEQEFILLRKTINDLVFLSQDSLKILQDGNQWYIPPAKRISTDSIVSRILADTAVQKVSFDTVVRKKQGLLKRIFKAQDELLVSNSVTQYFNSSQVDAMYRNIENLNNEQQRLYIRGSALLKNRFRALIQKERQVIQANYRLLSNLRNGIQNLKERDAEQRRMVDRKDITAHRESSDEFKGQLIVALSMMLAMLLLIFFYQSNASRYQKRLRLEKEYAARVAEEKTSILSNVSHEVRTPISSLLGVIEILKSEHNDHRYSADYLDSVVQEITMIDNSINDILNLSKLEAGKLEVKNAYFFPQRVLAETLKLHRHPAQKKGLTLQENINVQEDIEILGSAFRIKQITSNLLSNAIKYTERGTISLTADLVKLDQEQKLLISIQDTGIGISKEDQRHVFRKYYMTSSEAKSSFGLGLYISNLFAKQLNGRIAVESLLGKGSTFRLEIPYLNARFSGSKEQQHTLAALPETLHITFIDDNEINLMYLKHYFANRSNQVSFFSDPLQAISHIKSNSVGIVVTDMLMPGMNGWSVLSSIKQENTEIKVFLCTADTENIENYKGECTFQFDGMLTKPLIEHEFISQLLETKIFKKSSKMLDTD